LTAIPPDLNGNNGQQLKAVNRNCIMYIASGGKGIVSRSSCKGAKEFKIPKAQCTTCMKMVPLQIISGHIRNA